MNNEEAIERLTYIKTHDTDPEDYELFDLAIKALEKSEVKGDLISREALKKAFDEYGEKAKFTQDFCQRLIDKTPTVAVNCKDCNGYEAGYSAGLKDAERR